MLNHFAKMLAAVCAVVLFVFAPSRAAEGPSCERAQSVCFGLDWKTASPSDVRRWLAGGGDPAAQEFAWDASPLFFAAHFNPDPKVAEALIAAGADVRAVDDGGGTPLHYAAGFNGNPKVADALIAAGADARAADDEGDTPLHYAAWHNRSPKMIDALVADGAADIWTQDRDGDTPLHRAAAHNPNPAVAAALIARGAKVNATNAVGGTPLHYAAGGADSAVVEMLIAKGADVAARDIGGDAPLHDAARRNNDSAVIDALIAAGADVAAQNIVGDMPLHDAAAYNGNPAVLDALLARGADVLAKDKDGKTPADLAAEWRYKNPAVADKLRALQREAEYAAKWPLQDAAKSGDIAKVRALLEDGEDPNQADDDGKTAADYAFTARRQDVYALIYRQGGRRSE